MNVLITGANRGIGLGFVQNFLNRGDPVVAACRQPDAAQELRHLADASAPLHIVRLDLADEAGFADFAARLPVPFLDTLILNAGIPHSGTWEDSENWQTLTQAGLLQVLQINAVAPLLLAQHLSPRLGDGGTIAAVSSYFGSIGGAKDHWMYNNFGYAASKAILNLWMRNLSMLLCDRNIAVLSLDPGWVRTDMGGANADLSVEESVAGMIRILDKSAEHSGHFVAWNGKESPW